MVQPGGEGVPGARGRLWFLRSENMDRAGPLVYCTQYIRPCTAMYSSLKLDQKHEMTW